MNPKVSVIVCTRNRRKPLEKCLKSLKSQTAPSSSFEVIVVDNNSTESIKKIVQKYKFRYIFEKKIGLSHARNTGYKKAKYNWIAYIDDDAIADKNWIKNIQTFVIRHKDISIFGGPYFRYSHTPIPAWIPKDRGTKDLGSKEKKLKPNFEWVSGGNMIVKKKILEKYGGFKPHLGMKGSKLGFGEETELQKRLLDDGYDLYYAPQVKIKHLFSLKKYHLRWHLKKFFINGIYAEKSIRGKRNIFYRTYDLLIGLKNIFYWLLIPRKIPFKRRVYFGFKKILIELGSIYGIIFKK